MALTFSVPGDPVPQPRPRVSTRGGFARAYVPSTHPVHHYRKCVAACAIEAGLKKTGEPLNVVIDAVFVRPKSHMRKSGVRPDAPRLFSKTVTATPACCKVVAHDKPAKPAPMMAQRTGGLIT